MNRTLTAVAFTLLLLFPSASADPYQDAKSLPEILKLDGIALISATPTTRVSAGPEKSKRDHLGVKDRHRERLVIKRTPDGWVWSSREDRPLTLHRSGVFLIFYTKGNPGAYVKLVQVDGVVYYFEHVNLGLQTITYWGEAALVRT